MGCFANWPRDWAENKTFLNQSWQNRCLLVLYCLTVAVKGLKSPTVFTVSVAVAKRALVMVGRWLPCCSPSLKVDGPTRDLSDQGLCSILAVLRWGVRCPWNEAASPAMSEEKRGREARVWLTPFPIPLITDAPNNFLHGLSIKKLEAMVNPQVKGPPFALEQGILTGWRPPAFSARAGGA